MQCLRVAMLCVRDRAEHRPTMSEVVTMLPSIKTPKDRKVQALFLSKLCLDCT